MCACEPGYLCPRCADTPADPRYLDDDPRDDEARARVAFSEGRSAYDPAPQDFAGAEARAWEQRTIMAELDAGHIGGAP